MDADVQAVLLEPRHVSHPAACCGSSHLTAGVAVVDKTLAKPRAVVRGGARSGSAAPAS